MLVMTTTHTLNFSVDGLLRGTDLNELEARRSKAEAYQERLELLCCAK